MDRSQEINLDEQNSDVFSANVSEAWCDFFFEPTVSGRLSAKECYGLVSPVPWVHVF